MPLNATSFSHSANSGWPCTPGSVCLCLAMPSTNPGDRMQDKAGVGRHLVTREGPHCLSQNYFGSLSQRLQSLRVRVCGRQEAVGEKPACRLSCLSPSSIRSLAYGTLSLPRFRVDLLTNAPALLNPVKLTKRNHTDTF